MLLDEIIRPSGISAVKLDLVGDKECEEERSSITNNLNLCEASNQNALAARDPEGNWLDLSMDNNIEDTS